MNAEDIDKLIQYIPTRQIISAYGGRRDKITSWMDVNQCFSGMVRDAFGGDEVDGRDNMVDRLGISYEQAKALFGMCNWDGVNERNNIWESFTIRTRQEQDTILIDVLTQMRDRGTWTWGITLAAVSELAD